MENSEKRVHRWVSVLIVALAIIAIGVLFLLMPEARNDWTDQITASTVTRTPLPTEIDLDVEYYTDEQGDIFQDEEKLEEGMKAFYSKTGVRPYIYVMSENTMSTSRDASYHFLQIFQDIQEKIGDEPFYLLIYYFTPYERSVFHTANNGAESIMDDEATTILTECLNLENRDYLESNDEIFSWAFAQTADRIMGSPFNVTGFLSVCILVVMVAVMVVLTVRRRRWDKRTIEQEKSRRLRRFLKRTPLRRFADTELDELEKKYQGESGQTPQESEEK